MPILTADNGNKQQAIAYWQHYYHYYMEGVGFIVKNISRFTTALPNMASIAIAVLGAATLAASFFVLRGHNRSIENLKRRVFDLEYDRLYAAYKEQGFFDVE